MRYYPADTWATNGGRNLLSRMGGDDFYVDIARCTHDELLELHAAIHKALNLPEAAQPETAPPETVTSEVALTAAEVTADFL